MVLSRKEFSKLCQQFFLASSKNTDAIMAEMDRDEIYMGGMSNLGDISKTIAMTKANWETIFKFISIAAIKAPICAVGQNLPEKFGGKFFKEQLEDGHWINLDYLFAEYAAKIQLIDKIPLMRIADKMPDKMKTAEGLSYAEEANLSSIAYVINSYMKPKLS